MFLLSVLLFGLVHSAPLQLMEKASVKVVENAVDTDGVANIGDPVDFVVNPVMLETLAQNATKPSTHTKDEASLVVIKSLVNSMSKGDKNLTAFIVRKLGELRTKTYAEHKVINARVARKLAKKKIEVSALAVQTKKTNTATAQYSAEVSNSKYETLQVNREIRALDRIMAQVNAMSDWTKCPSGWYTFGRSCYRVLARVDNRLGEAKCLAVGASLIRVDSPDDKAAIASLTTTTSGPRDTHVQLGFFRSLKTGAYEYIDGQAVNPASWYSWVNSGQTKTISSNFVGLYGPNKRLYALAASGWAPLCEHRLAVNLLK